MLEFLIVGIGGSVGSCLRFALTKSMHHFAVSLPLGTLISNIIAGIFIGFFIGLEESVFSLSPRAKLFLTTGLCGGLSTFSTFSLETVVFFSEGKYVVAVLNIILNLGISILGVIVGMTIAKLLFKKGI
ncbi:MAG: fluoride efflux transporter CrcB [Lachnospiraceae bacterium]